MLNKGLIQGDIQIIRNLKNSNNHLVNNLVAGQKASLERQSTLYEETIKETPPNQGGEFLYQQEGGDNYYSAYNNGDGEYQQEQQYDDYNYDYNYCYSGVGVGVGSGGDEQTMSSTSNGGYILDETGQWIVDDGKASQSYGYYDETGYYYDGQWYPYTTTEGEDWSTNDQSGGFSAADTTTTSSSPYATTTNTTTTTGAVASTTSTTSTTAVAMSAITTSSTAMNGGGGRAKQLSPSPDIYAKRRTMLHHGDLSSSGGSLDSNDQPLTTSSILQQQQQRRQNERDAASGATANAFNNSSPPMPMLIGELDRLQSDLLAATMTPRSSIQGVSVGGLLDPTDAQQQRRGSTQSHMSQMSQQ